MSLLPLPVTQLEEPQERKGTSLPYPEFNTQGDHPPQSKVTSMQKWNVSGGERVRQGEDVKQRLSELEQMLNEAQSRAAIVEQEAYDKAYAAGEKAGLALGEKRAEQILESMQVIVTRAEEELLHFQQQTAFVVIEMSEVILQQVLGEDSEKIGDTLQKSVLSAVEQLHLESKPEMVLSISPKDREMFSRMVNLPSNMKLSMDDNVQVGSCKLLSKHHDTLIDPKGMLKKAIEYLHEQLPQSVERKA